MAKPQRFLVTLPTPHDATAWMARTIHQEGLLGDYAVPLNVSNWRVPALIDERLNFDQWRYPIPAISAAPLHELTVAGIFRLLTGRKRFPRLTGLAGWRAAALDRRAARQLRDGNYTAVTILHERTPRVTAMARRLGIPTILFLNGDPWTMKQRLQDIADRASGSARREITSELPYDAIARADRNLAKVSMVVVESTRMARVCRERSPDKPVFTVGQGVDVDFFVPPPREYLPGPLKVAQVSRVAYGKGIQVTDEAVKLAGPAVSRCTVAGWDANTSPALVARCTALTFEGGLPKSGVRRLMQESDVFVLPTFADPMPRVVLEAMACGLPVITTADSGYDDVIEHGVNGFLVPLGNPEAVAALLNRLCTDTDLRARVGLAARATAEQNSWPQFGERFRHTLHAEILPSLAAFAR